MINEINIVGKILNEPRISKITTGIPVITCSIFNKAQFGKPMQIQCSFFNKEYLNEKLHQGMKILVHGQLQLRTIEKDGNEIQFYEILGEELEIINSIT